MVVAPRRADRRRARTRAALLAAARELLVRRGTTEVSIQDITDAADVGVGSFYNHFDSKDELFTEAVAETLEEYGTELDAVAAQYADPAERYAVGVRMTARLAWSRPAVAQILVRAGQDFLVSDRGLAPRALHDIESGIASGRFTVANAHVALVVTAGSVLGYLQVAITRPGVLVDQDAVELAELLLRTLGVRPSYARAAARRPLDPPARPAGPAWDAASTARSQE